MQVCIAATGALLALLALIFAVTVLDRQILGTVQPAPVLNSMAVGPQLVGIVSDLLRPHVGEEALRYALLASMLRSMGAAWCFWRVGHWLADGCR